MPEDPQVIAQDVAAELSAFTRNPNYSQLVAQVNRVDWAKAPLNERMAVREAFMATPEMQAAKRKLNLAGMPSDGIGGALAASLLVGGGGGGGALFHESPKESA